MSHPKNVGIKPFLLLNYTTYGQKTQCLTHAKKWSAFPCQIIFRLHILDLHGTMLFNKRNAKSIASGNTAEQPQGFDENQQVARRGGNVAGVARKALEAETGKPVVTAQNAESFHQLVTAIGTDAAKLPEKQETANEE